VETGLKMSVDAGVRCNSSEMMFIAVRISISAQLSIPLRVAEPDCTGHARYVADLFASYAPF